MTQVPGTDFPLPASADEVTAEWFHSRRTHFLKRFDDRLSGMARSLLDQLEFAPKVANERLANAPSTLLLGDFHLDNIVFEKQNEPVMLDWSRPVVGPQALNLASLVFGMTPLNNFDLICECYIDEYNKVGETSFERAVLERHLDGALLRRFSSSTCGIALWQPSLPRAVEMIDVSIEQTNRTVEFWQSRDPELFSFLR
jgi:hypothetical protein